MRIDVVRKSLLTDNERAAAMNRALLNEAGVMAINVLGGAGCGKTTLLEGIIPRLSREFSVAVLEGDIATTRDAERIASLGVPVVQLLTDGACHLSATLVYHGLDRLELDALDLLFIENVGNPICPANFDLGEHGRLAVLSVTEGDDKPYKYPYLFKTANRVVISKLDLLPHCDFDLDRAMAGIHALGPEKPIDRIVMNDPRSMEPLIAWLRDRARLAVPVS